MAKKVGLSPDSLLEQFTSKKIDQEIDLKTKSFDLTTSQISDALKNLTGKSGVIPKIKPMKKKLRISGRVVTVKTEQKDWGTPLKAIENAKKDEIIFISSDGDDFAVWGEIFSTYAQKKGLQATVIFGAMRDIDAVCSLNYPVFSRAVVPNAGEPRAKGETDLALECGELEVKPGDWIFGDDCGVVVVAEELVDKIIHDAIQIKKNEDKILRQLEEGESLSHILGI